MRAAAGNRNQLKRRLIKSRGVNPEARATAKTRRTHATDGLSKRRVMGRVRKK
jgi:hypothetical protein